MCIYIYRLYKGTVFSCVREQNDEGTPEVVWNHALKNTAFSYMFSLRCSIQKVLRRDSGKKKTNTKQTTKTTPNKQKKPPQNKVFQGDYYHGQDKMLVTEERQNDDLFSF